jgi:hypothetical protein
LIEACRQDFERFEDAKMENLRTRLTQSNSKNDTAYLAIVESFKRLSAGDAMPTVASGSTLPIF